MEISKSSFFDISLSAIATEFGALGLPAFRARQVIEWVYSKRIFDFANMSNLPAALRTQLDERFSLTLPKILTTTGEKKSARKFLLGLADGESIECVLLAASEGQDGERASRLTLCVSSQVGCAYGCTFCASGLGGWRRDLSTGEILAQLLAIEAATGERLDNIVFMGMGEPFANYENVMAAIATINAPDGIGIGARHITVSTSGIPQRIRNFADQPLQLRLAISLHACTDELRSSIMPINRKYPLDELLAACAYFASRKKQFLTFEYILIEGVNDNSTQAAALAALARHLRAKVNLIPYNPIEGISWCKPSRASQEAFLDTLLDSGITATLRREKGNPAAAACGQLRLSQKVQ